ncbi:hypothetical protein [Catenulispora pinisilvae]|uniref:hypothetical protein n=1 Tax=Catenulispora pinisilvae TaxID=2705253 RepID=UPI0018921745|nr:hypothetical protein [Catenulispora pinisilvae]
MTDTIPDVVADPIGVMVDLVAAVEPALGRPVIEGLVRAAAGGRAKQRKLASALADRPQILIDGRSPAPRTIGDLLIALRSVGAVVISPPVCAQCGKHLRSLQRRGEDWYCGICGERREPCSACGKTRSVQVRDRDGQPRCGKCPPDDGRDPIQTVIEVVAAIDPDLPVQAVVAAVESAVPTAGRRHALAWALADRPELLTGTGATAPTPAVLRLIDGLCDAGSQSIIHPACPRCQRVLRLHRRIDGQWLCRNCVAKSRAQPCSRCGAVREAATRDEHGRPLCPYCLISDPANLENCTVCARRRRVSVRTPDGPICETCRPIPTVTCSICSREAPCVISKATGQPWRHACAQRWARCDQCGQVRRIRSGTITKPVCSTCTREDPEFWRSCSDCGQPGRIRAGRCARCTVDRRLHELLADADGRIRPHLEPLYQTLAKAERPGTVAAWLDKGGAPAILRELEATDQMLTHQALDSRPAGKPVEHLRAVLVAIGTLPPRDEQMTRLERWITATIADRGDPEERGLLHRYAVWHLLRRLRRRSDGENITHNQLVAVRQHLRAATVLLDWLTGHGLTLATCTQGDLEAWLCEPEATHRREAGHFVRWAKNQKLTGVDLPAVKWGGPTRAIDTEARWEQARRLLHDDTIAPDDRVAGLLVLLYAQWPATISRLTLDHVQTTDEQTRLSLGHEPLVLPEPLAGLVRQLVATRRGHATLGDAGNSRWLFPGGQPGRPVSAYQLAERVRQLGISPGQARSTALFGLATDLPAALLARMLGIHISVAVAWQRASNGDWTGYAADVSRRGTTATSTNRTP